jgi:nucleoside-diphosphate-sugar epimerase
MRLKDKVAIVTGAASGMGAATARRFAREGAAVVVADVLVAEGKAIADSITATGQKALFLTLDVSQEAAWKQVVETTVETFGKLDILVNNAGISGSATNNMLDSGLWERLMAINATGTFLGIAAAVPVMQRNGGGAIVNLSSISGVVGQSVVHMGYAATPSIPAGCRRCAPPAPPPTRRCGRRCWKAFRWAERGRWMRWLMRCCSWLRTRRLTSRARNFTWMGVFWRCERSFDLDAHSECA